MEEIDVNLSLFKKVESQISSHNKSEDKIREFIENDVLSLARNQLSKKSKKEKLLNSLLTKIETQLDRLEEEEDIDIMKLTKIYEVIARIELESDSSLLENTLGLLKQPMVQNNVNSTLPVNNGVINNTQSFIDTSRKSVQDVTPEEISVLKKIIIEAKDPLIHDEINYVKKDSEDYILIEKSDTNYE
jgi:hypothetical protein